MAGGKGGFSKVALNTEDKLADAKAALSRANYDFPSPKPAAMPALKPKQTALPSVHENVGDELRVKKQNIDEYNKATR